MSHKHDLRFLGGTIIELSEEMIAKTREGLAAYPDFERQAEVVFVLDDEVYTTDFDNFVAYIRSQQKREW